jgi:isopenicillin N synthase-like dioxygenase
MVLVPPFKQSTKQICRDHGIECLKVVLLDAYRPVAAVAVVRVEIGQFLQFLANDLVPSASHAITATTKRLFVNTRRGLCCLREGKRIAMA